VRFSTGVRPDVWGQIALLRKLTRSNVSLSVEGMALIRFILASDSAQIATERGRWLTTMAQCLAAERPCHHDERAKLAQQLRA
jgi:hypothetical protein